MKSVDRPLRVFVCYAEPDKISADELHSRLKSVGWIDPWFAEKSLLPGQDWEFEIRKAIKSADIVLVLLSDNSIKREGFVQKEIKLALDLADEKPDGTIFIVPLRLDDCGVPERLSKKQWLDYFSEGAFMRLLDSLRLRSVDLGINVGEYKKIIKPLSPREAEVLSCVLREMSNKEIATSLGVSHQTVKNHVTSILRKLGVQNRNQAMMLAFQSEYRFVE